MREAEGDMDVDEKESELDMEIESPLSKEEKDKLILEDAKAKRAERRKAILKELEVCDLLDLRNPQCVAEYATQIYEQMKIEEPNFLVSKSFLDSTQIKEKHRRKLCEWLSDFLKKFRLLPETYAITCKRIDLTIAKAGCQQSELHLLSLGSLLIAMKYEEIYPPSLKSIIRTASRDPEFTHEDVKQMERHILTTLDFNVTFPTAYRFLMRIQKLVNADEQTFFLAQYLCEYTMLYVVFQTINPSLVACGCMYLARSNLGRRPGWNVTFSKSTGYS